MKDNTRAVALVAVVALTLGLTTTLNAQAPSGAAGSIRQQHVNAVEGPLTLHPDGSFSGEAAAKNPPSPICSTTTSSAANVDTDCESIPGPHNETSIAVNPTNPLNQIGSANDYQLILSSGGHLFETIFSRAHVTFDGGRTWTTSVIRQSAYDATGDPAVAFDADGTAYLSTLGFRFSQGRFCCVNPDVIVSHSTDGGLTWSAPIVRVATGTGTFSTRGIFNDKPYITAWGHGNAIVTYTRFNDGLKGVTINAPIFASVTHDGGNTWTTPVEISGSAPFCHD
jgi:hypothetical protein